MKKNLPLEKTRPDSAISSKMYLTVHRLTLQVRAMVSQRRRPTRKSCPSVFKTGRFGYLLSSFCTATLDPGLVEQRAGLYGSESQYIGRGKGSNVSGSSGPRFQLLFFLPWTLVESCCQTPVFLKHAYRLGKCMLGAEKDPHRSFLYMIFFWQRPSLRYPEHLRKLQYNLKRAEGPSGTILPSATALPLCSLMSLGPQSHRVTWITQEAPVLEQLLAWSWPGKQSTIVGQVTVGSLAEGVGSQLGRGLSWPLWLPGYRKQQKQQQRKVETSTEMQV